MTVLAIVLVALAMTVLCVAYALDCHSQLAEMRDEHAAQDRRISQLSRQVIDLRARHLPLPEERRIVRWHDRHEGGQVPIPKPFTTVAGEEIVPLEEIRRRWEAAGP